MQEASALWRSQAGSDFNSSYRTICLIVGNIISHPHEEKYRSIKKSSRALQSALIPGAMEVLRAAGFVEDTDHLFFVDETENLEGLRAAHAFLLAVPAMRAREAQARMQAQKSSPQVSKAQAERAALLRKIACNKAERAGVKAKTSHSQLNSKGANIARLDLSNQRG